MNIIVTTTLAIIMMIIMMIRIMIIATSARGRGAHRGGRLRPGAAGRGPRILYYIALD